MNNKNRLLKMKRKRGEVAYLQIMCIFSFFLLFFYYIRPLWLLNCKFHKILFFTLTSFTMAKYDSVQFDDYKGEFRRLIGVYMPWL